MKLTDHFGNSEFLEVGDMDMDYNVVDLTISNDTDKPIRIMLNEEDLIKLSIKIEKLLE